MAPRSNKTLATLEYHNGRYILYDQYGFIRLITTNKLSIKWYLKELSR